VALVRTVLMRLDDTVDAGVFVDTVAEEAVSAFLRNDSGRDVEVYFEWRNNSDRTLVVPPVGEVTQAIPPGLRKWVPLSVVDDDGELDTDIRSYWLRFV